MSAGPDPSYIDLRARARERVDCGRLPSRLVECVTAGYGSQGKACSLCDQAITPAQVEYEILGYGKAPFTLHLSCYTAWRDECLERTRERDEASQRANPPLVATANAPERT